MHVSSDMFTEQEIERVNDGENILVTIDKDCSAGYYFRDGCDISIITTPFSHCEIFNENGHYTARPSRGFEITKITDNSNRVVAYKYRMTTYKLYHFADSYQSISNPVPFQLTCINKRTIRPFKGKTKRFRDKSVKRFNVISLYCKCLLSDSHLYVVTEYLQ